MTPWQSPHRMEPQWTHNQVASVPARIAETAARCGWEGVSRNKKTGAVVSESYVVTGGERETDLATRIIHRIKAKSAKGYDPETVLMSTAYPTA